MYANIIIDISHESVDRVFQYRVPGELAGKIRAGSRCIFLLEREIRPGRDMWWS